MQGIEKYKVGIRFKPNGEIFISSEAAKLLDLGAGDSIDIAVESPEIYLLAVKNPPPLYRGILRPTKKGAKCLRTNWKELSQMMLSQCECAEAAFRFGDTKVINDRKALSIITRKNYAV